MINAEYFSEEEVENPHRKHGLPESYEMIAQMPFGSIEQEYEAKDYIDSHIQVQVPNLHVKEETKEEIKVDVKEEKKSWFEKLKSIFS